MSRSDAQKQINIVNYQLKLYNFLVKIFGDDIPSFAHAIKSPLNMSACSVSDVIALCKIEKAYPESYLDSVDVLNRKGKAFIYFKADNNKLTDAVYEALDIAAADPKLDSPIYMTFGNTGELLLD
jgi:hypothetical protein